MPIPACLELLGFGAKLLDLQWTPAHREGFISTISTNVHYCRALRLAIRHFPHAPSVTYLSLCCLSLQLSMVDKTRKFSACRDK
jgi:hypothetical protein